MYTSDRGMIFSTRRAVLPPSGLTRLWVLASSLLGFLIMKLRCASLGPERARHYVVHVARLVSDTHPKGFVLCNAENLSVNILHHSLICAGSSGESQPSLLQYLPIIRTTPTWLPPQLFPSRSMSHISMSRASEAAQSWSQAVQQESASHAHEKLQKPALWSPYQT